MNAGMTGSMEELVREALATGTLSDLPSRHFIKGRFVPSRSAATMETFDPGSGRPFATFAAAGDAGDVDQAVQAAKEALRGNWGHAGPAERGRVLYRAAELIRNAVGRLAVVVAWTAASPCPRPAATWPARRAPSSTSPAVSRCPSAATSNPDSGAKKGWKRCAVTAK
jgi:hypothetical protein